MHLRRNYDGLTPFDLTSRVRFFIVIALRGFSYLLCIALSIGFIFAGSYISFSYRDAWYSDTLDVILLTTLTVIDIPFIFLAYHTTEFIIQAWADRYYARMEYLEYKKTLQSHEVTPSRDKATLTLLYIAGFLFPPNERLAAQGDMEEQFNLARDKFGRFRAHCYLAYDICCTFFVKTAPLIKWLFKAASLASLGSFLIWLVNQIELVRTLYEYIFHK